MSVTESKTKTERKSSRKPSKEQETALSALLAQTAEVSVPLASLIKSPLNVRTVPYSAESVSELAESIKGVGLLQNLVVHTLPGDRYGVAAGGRRLAALNMLAERGIIPADWPVRVKVIPQELATAASMTENGHRRDMHPAEQIAGFRAMAQEGKTPAQIGDLLGYSPRHVQRMLKLADLAPVIDIVGEMINHNPDSLYPKRRQLDPYSDLNYQCVEDSFDLKVRADYLTLGLRENGRNSTARILNFHLARNPEIAFLWNVADNYSNLLNPELSISCPFILTLTLVVEDQVKTHSEANLKYMDLEKKSKTSYAKWFPSVEKEAKEWGELRQRLGSGQSSVVSYFLNITAFCKDNNETALEVEQDILNSFRKNGFELISPRFNHMRNFLTCLPFMAGKGLFKQLKEAGVVQRAESFNVANLMPLVADNPLTPAGLLAPTYRNQLAFIDIFFRGMNNTNYNMAVCGTSGAGKTGLIQPLIRSVLDSGGFAVVFDMGDGYKSLCENMGGVYLDGETLRFNPFANITDIDQSAERVRDQLSVMASPNGNLDEVHEGLLLQAVRASWLAKKNRARIDDVVDFLKNARDNDQYVESPTIRSRLDEMIVLLDQYTANGTYGQYFNSDEPSLRDDAKMVVLELGGLEDRPSLLVAVMFSLIIYIENRMYRTPRNLKKLNVIDEGWRLLDFKNHKVGEFIEKGYRTARRHTGAYITITQNIVDFDSDKASSAARAAWGNSSYKIILKQSAKEFAKYNQLYPDQFLPLQRDMIGKFGAAKDQWFSSFLLQVENHSSWHRLFVDPLSRAMYSSDGPDFEFVQQKRKEGLSIHEAVWQLAWKKSGPEMASLEAWLEEHEKYRSVA